MDDENCMAAQAICEQMKETQGEGIRRAPVTDLESRRAL